MTTFTIVNDETLCAAIAQCQQQLVYVAPGITQPVVEAMRQQLEHCENLQATLIVDIDPEVYRLPARLRDHGGPTSIANAGHRLPL